MRYHVLCQGKKIGDFTDKRDAQDYAASTGGTVKEVPETQDAAQPMEKLTQ